MNKPLFAASLLALALAGCGGSSGGQVGTAEGSDVSLGPITSRAVGVVKPPVSMQRDTSTVAGLFGANFTNVAVQLPAVTNFNADELEGTQTMMALSVVNSPLIYDLGTGQTVRVDSTLGNNFIDCAASFSSTGDKILAAQYPLDGSGLGTYTYNIDGTSKTLIGTTSDFRYTPSFNPAGTKIVYARNGDICVANVNGTGEVNLTNTPTESEYWPRFSPDGTKIGYLKYSTTSNSFQVWEMSATGTNPVARSSAANVLAWDYSPNGQEICFIDHASGASTYYLLRQALNNFSSPITVFSTTDQITKCIWSPTGASIAYTKQGTQNTVEKYTFTTGVRSYVYSLAPSGLLDDWVLLPRKRTFVGASGAVMNTNAAGFLYGTSGKNFRSLLTFDSTDRVNTSIDVSNQAGGVPSNFVATITTSGQLNMLRYVNGYMMPRITIIDPATTASFATGALVTYDSTDGTVASVLPYTAAKMAVKPTQTKTGNLVKFEGNFLGVYDKEGKRTASQVRSVTVDSRNGRVVSTEL